MRNLLFLLCAVLMSGIAQAAPVNADPFGLELGVATLADVQERLKGNDASEAGTSAITGGRMLVAESPKIGPDGLQRALFIFDKQGKLAAVQMTLPKDFGGKNVNEITDQLARKYTQKSRNLPSVGSGHARYTRGNSVVVVESPHMSFEFTVGYMTEDFQRGMAANEQAKKQQKTERSQSSL